MSVAVASALLAGTALAGCSSDSAESSAPAAAGSVVAPDAAPSPDIATPTVSTARLTITPADDQADVEPSAPVVVTAADGTIDTVSVSAVDGEKLEGTVDASGTRWTADAPLAFGTRYVVTATAVDGNGVGTTSTAAFRTLKPAKTVETSISPLSGSTVGVGMPIIVRLSEPVTDRAAVQRALTVRNSKNVTGVWSWISDEELQFRPQKYWPAGTDVSLDVGLTGVKAGPKVWGDETRTVSFTVGDAMISTVDVKKKQMTVRRNGKVQRTIPITTGKAGFLTRGGTKVISEKHRTKIMDAATVGTSTDSAEYYRLEVEYALRVTWTGEFLHAAPWSEGSQGAANVSHGCVGMSMSNGKWLFNNSEVGDVVEVVNSTRELEPGNGWTAWNVSWSDWVAGSAV